jgi:hypothetical protein
MISEPSAVRITLALIPMRRTSPTTPPTSMRSPILIARSKKQNQPGHEIIDDVL